MDTEQIPPNSLKVGDVIRYSRPSAHHGLRLILSINPSIITSLYLDTLEIHRSLSTTIYAYFKKVVP